MNPRRWVLVETWLSLGLRISWQPSYERGRVPYDSITTDDDTGLCYYYEGNREWYVIEPEERRRGRQPGYPEWTAPELSESALRHELAHYLTANEEQRSQRNFGASFEMLDDGGLEAHAMAAEQVIDAMINACGRICSLAMTRSA